MLMEIPSLNLANVYHHTGSHATVQGHISTILSSKAISGKWYILFRYPKYTSEDIYFTHSHTNYKLVHYIFLTNYPTYILRVFRDILDVSVVDVLSHKCQN